MSKLFSYHKDRDRDRFIGDSEQLWANAEKGYHMNSEQNVFSIENINQRYASNIRGWYLRIDMSQDERKRLMNTKLFKTLDRITNVRFFENMIGTGEEITLATVQGIGTGEHYNVILEDKGEVGDVIVSDYLNSKGYPFRVGVIISIDKTDVRYSNYENLIDVITDSTDAFKKIRDGIRIKELKREIKKRMSTIDERQQLEMYAKADGTIKDLLDELDSMKNDEPIKEEI